MTAELERAFPPVYATTDPASTKTCRSFRELILKRGLGKRRRCEREFEATPNPWPSPRGSDFSARLPTRLGGELLPGVSRRAARDPFT